MQQSNSKDNSSEAQMADLSLSWRWKGAIELFSFERFVQFFGAIGLPEEIVRDPIPLTQASQAYIRKMEAGGRKQELLTFCQIVQQELFIFLAQHYSPQSASYLESWCERYVVNWESELQLNFWSDVLSSMSRDDKEQVLARMEQFRSVTLKLIQNYNYEEDNRIYIEFEQQLDAISLEPANEWEEWITRVYLGSIGVQNHEGAILPVEGALCHYSLIRGYHHTFQVMQQLKTSLASQDYEPFLQALADLVVERDYTVRSKSLSLDSF
jgi:adenylate kinase family enzyme